MKTEPRNALSLSPFVCLSISLFVSFWVLWEPSLQNAVIIPRERLCVTLFVAARPRFNFHREKTKQQKLVSPRPLAPALRRRPRLTRRHDVTTEPSEGIPVGTARARSGSERGADAAWGQSRTTR